MRVKMILPALTEAKSPFYRPIKYSLFRHWAWQRWRRICTKVTV